MDLAELGLKVDSAPVVDADKALDDFATSAGKAGDAADDFAKDTEKVGSATDKMADDLKQAEEGFNLLAVGIGAAVAALGTGFIMGVTDAIGRLEEETKLLRQFDQVLQNTGNAANTTAEDFKSFADELQDSTGRAAEEILAVGANLASFGFENEIFYSSIRLANDMSAAWGGDLRSSLEGLGRALDDPINGFAMLQKRGISLTETQAATVKQLVEANKEFEAQAFIIETLAEQVGGAAEAGFTGFAAAVNRISEAIEGFFESIVEGTGLIDILTFGLNSAATAINFVSDNLGTIAALLAPIGAAVAVAFGPTALAAITALTTAITGPLLAAIGTLTAALLANPLGLLIAGVTAAIALFIRFREQLGLTDARLQAIGEVGARVFNIIVASVEKLYEAVAPTIGAIYDRLTAWGSYIIDVLSPAFVAFKDVVVPIFEEIWEWIDSILTGLEKILGIVPEVNDAKDKAGTGDGGGGDPALPDKIKKAHTEGGESAAKKLREGVEKGGMTAAEALNKAQAGTGKGFATALEKANASGAKKLSDGVTSGGDAAAAAIAAAGQVMASKFEGTGRNIYDLWNNWGDEFIGSFSTTIGDLLVDFQKAQTRLLRDQAALVRAQTENMKVQTELLRKERLTPQTETTRTKTSVDLSGGFGQSVDNSLSKYSSGQNMAPTTEMPREAYTLPIRSAPANSNSPTEVKLNVVNRVDPNDVLNTLSTKLGRDTVNNVISQDSDVLSRWG